MRNKTIPVILLTALLLTVIMAPLASTESGEESFYSDTDNELNMARLYFVENNSLSFEKPHSGIEERHTFASGYITFSTTVENISLVGALDGYNIIVNLFYFLRGPEETSIPMTITITYSGQESFESISSDRLLPTTCQEIEECVPTPKKFYLRTNDNDNLIVEEPNPGDELTVKIFWQLNNGMNLDDISLFSGDILDEESTSYLEMFWIYSDSSVHKWGFHESLDSPEYEFHSSLVFSSDNSLMASALSGDEDYNLLPSITIWDTSNWVKIATITDVDEDCDFSGLEFSPTGSELISYNRRYSWFL